MSRANPKKALAALLPLPVSAGAFTVRPMTLAMWAALERIDSPLLGVEARGKREEVRGNDELGNDKPPASSLDLIPSLYLLTHGAKEIFRHDFFDAALAWADTVPVTAIRDIERAARAQIQTVADVIPELDEDEPRKKATGRSPSSLAGRPPTPAGAGAKSSTKSR